MSAADLDVVRRFARDQWVRSHGTPRVTVIAGARAPARQLWDAWLSSAGIDGEARLFEIGEADEVDAAVRDAIELATAGPRRPIALIVPAVAIAEWRRGRDDRMAAMVDEGMLALPAPAGVAAGVGSPHSPPLLEARSLAELTLFDALDASPATAGRFELNASLAVMFGGVAAEVDLLSRVDRIAIEVDGYHHFGDVDCYRRDRRKDLLLQGQGLLVVRVLAEDVLRDAEGAVKLVVEAMAMRIVQERR